MTAWLVTSALLCWALVLRRRLVHAADVEHELRGALNAVGLAVERQREAALTAAYEGQLVRVRSALGDGGADRWSLARLLDGVTVPAGAAVVLGNVVANAIEHGDGPVVVRIDVANAVAPGTRERSGIRGRGLRIAARAASAAGGRLDVREEGGRFSAAVELPVER